MHFNLIAVQSTIYATLQLCHSDKLGPQFSAANFPKFRGPVCQSLRLTAAKSANSVAAYL